MKAAGWQGFASRKRTGSGPHFHSNREKATIKTTPPVNLKIAGSTGKNQCKQYAVKNTPDDKKPQKKEVSRDRVFLSTDV